ncbi:MAG: UDP-N-acetylmuramyl-tripeptide synthetase [Candidatus Magasanikbacteria bacterium]|nr:UDP-N-acetylmuramyl-tripeptide synthetase [Candidatus Magasanikbacteria bacterium]
MFIKKIFPKSILNLRHLFFAWYGAWKYNQPSEDLIVIGITGTSGKSSTVYFMRKCLEALGYTVGSLSTIDFYIDGQDQLNNQKMTMLGKMQTQKYLRKMVKAGCDIAIVETTSEGAVQYRDRYICYDFMILTNLYPEHIESHGSYENYVKAKMGIVKRAGLTKRKNIAQLLPTTIKKIKNKYATSVPKIVFINGEVAEAEEFLKLGNYDWKVMFGQSEKLTVPESSVNTPYLMSHLQSREQGIAFKVEDVQYQAPLYGVHNAYNLTVAIAVLRELGATKLEAQGVIATCTNAPGRNEFISEAETKGFKVIVDYSFEPKAMGALYEVVKLLSPKKIIHVFGSTGGGRDVSRRFSVGELVGTNADVCVVTDEDPYDDEPMKIMNDVAEAVRKTGKKDNENLFIIPDRRAAIAKALSIAGPNDLVLVTGKGSEQAIVVAGGKKIPWDDRQVVREELAKLL